MDQQVGVLLNTSSGNFMSFWKNMQGFDFWVNGIAILVIALWVINIVWVAKDISARTNSIWAQLGSVILALVFGPVLGLPLYLIFRPVSYKYDRIPWREAAAFSLVVCYNCRTLNDKNYDCCVNCGEALKIKCKECGKKYPHVYNYCAYCGAPNIE